MSNVLACGARERCVHITEGCQVLVQPWKGSYWQSSHGPGRLVAGRLFSDAFAFSVLAVSIELLRYCV